MAVCHTTFVKSVNPGGRLFDAIHETEIRKNGEIGKLGIYHPAGQSQIKKFEKVVAADITSTMPLGIVMQPEMLYDNSRMSLQKLELMQIEPNTPFVFVPLEEGDKFEITADLITGGDITTATVGQTLQLANNSSLYTFANNTAVPAAGGRYFEIVKIKDAHARTARIGGEFAKGNYKLYTLELKVVR